VRTSPNLPGWTTEVPLAGLLGSATGRRPAVLNDANAFVLAETRLGAGEGHRHVVGLTLGTGVGGGLVLDGRLWTGRHGAAGEIGHVCLLADGPRCACGARGCLEAMVGTRAILDRYAAMAEAPATAATPRDIAARALAGEAAAVETWRETGRLLGLALAWALAQAGERENEEVLLCGSFHTLDEGYHALGIGPRETLWDEAD